MRFRRCSYHALVLLALVLLAASVSAAADHKAHYIGPEACALCHKDIAAKQAQSAMAGTWQAEAARWLGPSFNASAPDDPHYLLKRSGDLLVNEVNLGAGKRLSLRVAMSLGGRRHGLGFLLSLNEIDGMPLARPVMLQARYAWSPEQKRLLLAPGCPLNSGTSLESKLGLVLSPTFRSRCLDCHGQPGVSGSGPGGGVHCEACHGPGSEHLIALAKGSRDKGIVNPNHLSSEQSIAICARCHTGLSRFADPSPTDLLVANQALAIQTSECFIQSGKAFSCTNCHDPHGDSSADAKRAVSTCLGCHSTAVTLHAAICPINRNGNCIGCHMKSADLGALHLVDHVIRVHPEDAGPKKAPRELAFNSQLQSNQIQTTQIQTTQVKATQVKAVSEYLRMIATGSPEAAENALQRLDEGESFYAVARQISADHSSAIGGYLGRKVLADLPKELATAAVALNYGQTSRNLQTNGRWIILQRLPRDFRWQAEQMQNQAEALAANGNSQAAIGKSQEALMLYPQFLRALLFIGNTFTQDGNPKRGAEVLSVAHKLYPTDAGAEFALAGAFALLGERTKAIEAYRHVISLEADFTAAYVNLGQLQCSAKEWPGAIDTFKQGLQIDPMSAELAYDLGLAQIQSGDIAAGRQAIRLARGLDEDLVKQREVEQ